MKTLKVTPEEIIKSKAFYEDRVKMRTARLEKMKEMHFPQIVIDNEERMLKEYKNDLFVFVLALDMYKKGFKDGTNADYKNMALFDKKDLTPEEILERAIFGPDEE